MRDLAQLITKAAKAVEDSPEYKANGTVPRNTVKLACNKQPVWFLVYLLLDSRWDENDVLDWSDDPDLYGG